MKCEELLPCPFCGGEARAWKYSHPSHGEYWRVVCNEPSCCISGDRPTEAEAIAAWNTRTPIEYDGWFYLPKPKDGIVQYGEPEMTRTENGYKVWQTADVVAEAARKWGDELGEYVMRRICEIWNTRSAGTCHLFRRAAYGTVDGVELALYECSECGEPIEPKDGWNYCPNCGRKVSA